jgi:kanamycin kinase
VVPRAVVEFIDGRPFEAVWQNGLGGLTFRIGARAGEVYLKWAPTSSGVDLTGEVERLEWARVFISVPEVIEQGSDDEGRWFVTRAIDAENAVSDRWKRDPKTASAAVGAGLREMHTALPVVGCPYRWTAADRLAAVEDRVEAGRLDQHEWSEPFSFDSPRSALEELRDTPAEDLVVCHGDACVPNTLVDLSGRYRAHVDLGCLGVGDRWADLAVASWSTVWNYGPGWEQNVYDAYGVDPDHSKIRYYRLLWEME